MSKPRCRVLFVCYGNLCRSPMAEAMFRAMVEEAGLAGDVAVESAGVGAWCEGGPAHPDTRAVLEQRGIDASGLRVRGVGPADAQSFDWVIAMDRENLRDLRARGSWRGRLELLLRFAPDCGRLDVPDPYLTGGFPVVAELVEQGCLGLLQEVRAGLRGPGSPEGDRRRR